MLIRLANILVDKFRLKMVKFRKFANISYFISNHQMTLFCHQSNSKIAKLALHHQTWHLSRTASLTAYAYFYVTASSEQPSLSSDP